MHVHACVCRRDNIHLTHLCHSGAVAGAVGSGGNIGAVVWGMIFLFRCFHAYTHNTNHSFPQTLTLARILTRFAHLDLPSGQPAEDCLMILAFCCLGSAALCPFIFVGGEPGMICSPHLNAAQKEAIKDQKHTDSTIWYCTSTRSFNTTITTNDP